MPKNFGAANHSRVKLEKAAPEDLKDVVKLVNRAYRGESSRLGWTTEADFLEGQRTDLNTLREELASSSAKTLLVLRGKNEGPTTDTVIGTVLLEIAVDKKGIKSAQLAMLTVDPEIQGQGLGKILLNEAEDFARSLGASKIRLSVIHLRETLIAWYERQGYRRTGQTEAFPYGDERFGLPLRKDLYFLVFEKDL